MRQHARDIEEDNPITSYYFPFERNHTCEIEIERDGVRGYRLSFHGPFFEEGSICVNITEGDLENLLKILTHAKHLGG